MIKLLFSTQTLNKVTITHVILMSLVLHAFVISHPQDWLVADENFFAWAARTLLEGEDRMPHQFPGLHVIGAVAISLFRDTWFSLRVPIVIFGMLTMLIFYNICIRYTSRQNAILATTILSFDTIFFLHSQLFMRDVPMLFVGMMSFYLYLKKRYYLAAFTLGIGSLIKETGLFFLMLITIYHLGTNLEKLKHFFMQKSSEINKVSILKTTGIFFIILSGSFLLPLWVYDIIFTPNIYEPMIPVRELSDGTIVPTPYPLILVSEARGFNVQNQTGIVTNPIQHIEVYLTKGYLAGTSDPKNHILTQVFFPQNWVLPILPNMDERLGVGMGWKKAKPFDEIKNGLPYKGEILGVERLGFSNLALWPVAFWGTLSFIAYSVIKRQNSKSGLFLAAGITSMYVPFILIYIFNIRTVYPYFFIYTIPFISLGVILLFDKIRNDKLRFLMKFILLAGVVAWFVWLFPVKIFGQVMLPI